MRAWRIVPWRSPPPPWRSTIAAPLRAGTYQPDRRTPSLAGKVTLFCCTNRQRAAGCAVFQAAPGAAGLRLRWRPSCALRPLDGAGELDPRRYAHLADDVPPVGLGDLLAEEQLVRDLRVGLSVDHEHGELELAFGQRLERRPGR